MKDPERQEWDGRYYGFTPPQKTGGRWGFQYQTQEKTASKYIPQIAYNRNAVGTFFIYANSDPTLHYTYGD